MELLERLFNKRFTKDLEFRIGYIVIYGICMFGTTIAFGNIDLYFMSAERIMFSLMVYGIMSVIWGIVVSYSVSKNILKEQGQ